MAARPAPEPTTALPAALVGIGEPVEVYTDVDDGAYVVGVYGAVVYGAEVVGAYVVGGGAYVVWGTLEVTGYVMVHGQLVMVRVVSEVAV